VKSFGKTFMEIYISIERPTVEGGAISISEEKM
jgi:hypothetical protein